MSSFYGSPASFGAPLPSSAGLDQYASAMSSQPSWASTSSNLWGAPGGLPGAEVLGRSAGGMNGTGDRPCPVGIDRRHSSLSVQLDVSVASWGLPRGWPSAQVLQAWAKGTSMTASNMRPLPSCSR